VPRRPLLMVSSSASKVIAFDIARGAELRKACEDERPTEAALLQVYAGRARAKQKHLREAEGGFAEGNSDPGTGLVPAGRALPATAASAMGDGGDELATSLGAGCSKRRAGRGRRIRAVSTLETVRWSPIGAFRARQAVKTGSTTRFPILEKGKGREARRTSALAAAPPRWPTIRPGAAHDSSGYF